MDATCRSPTAIQQFLLSLTPNIVAYMSKLSAFGSSLMKPIWHFRFANRFDPNWRTAVHNLQPDCPIESKLNNRIRLGLWGVYRSGNLLGLSRRTDRYCLMQLQFDTL